MSRVVYWLAKRGGTYRRGHQVVAAASPRSSPTCAGLNVNTGWVGKRTGERADNGSCELCGAPIAPLRCKARPGARISRRRATSTPTPPPYPAALDVSDRRSVDLVAARRSRSTSSVQVMVNVDLGERSPARRVAV